MIDRCPKTVYHAIHVLLAQCLGVIKKTIDCIHQVITVGSNVLNFLKMLSEDIIGHYGNTLWEFAFRFDSKSLTNLTADVVH